MPPANRLIELIANAAARDPNALAILAPGRTALTFGGLLEHLHSTARSLRDLGIGPHARVAVVLPNGPELATAFLSVAAAAVCAPLNPDYREREVDFTLADLGAEALLALPDSAAPAVAVARSRGIPILEIRVDPRRPAGSFELVGAAPPRSGKPPAVVFGEPDDTALLLHTSGTTSRPKLVPLSGRNLCSSAHHIAQALSLGAADRCLNVMPLFHIHGLVGGTLASLAAGGSLIATPGFDARRCFEWLRELEPTWYTAVPTIHQALLERAGERADAIATSSLRLIRSSSSALAPSVMAELERTFGVPVIESYGMTEAAHQMASNPLPPAERRPGSVGRAAGPEVAVMDDAGRLLPAGSKGEVVIRGANVMRGYERNPDANASAFTNGWFRTGDQGFLDVDGYLHLTGRLKEIINRGGEKIAPREIDEVLLAHPAVAQAVAFAVPDARLGEEVAAAVVLRQGAKLRERDLLAFAAERLASFKLPRRTLFLDEIPKGPTGKLQRIGLAAQLGVGGALDVDAPDQPVDPVAPRTPLERELAALCAQALGVAEVGVTHDFFALGGDSLMATEWLAAIQRATGVVVPVYLLFDVPSVEALAAFVAAAGDAEPIAAGAPADEHRAPSYGQTAVWAHEVLVRDTPANHTAKALQLRGELDLAALRAALGDVVRRHAALRSSFSVQRGRPVLETAPAGAVALQVEEIGAADAATLDAIARREAHERFDLTRGPLYRFKLLRRGARDAVLLATFHHSVFDGWSTSIFARELVARHAAHRGRARAGSAALAGPDVLAELDEPLDYAAWASWQRRRVEGGALADAIEAWRRRLAAAPAPLELPGAPAAASAGAPDWQGTLHTLELDAALTQRVRALAREAGTTPFVVLFASFKAFLRGLTDREDLVIGTLAAGRTRAETLDTIGLFMNPLAVRTDLSGATHFSEVLAAVRASVSEALAGEEVPFEALVRALRPATPLGRHPFFEVAFLLRNLPPVASSSDGLALEELPIDFGIARYDWLVEVLARDGGLLVRSESRDARVAAASVRGWLERWLELLTGWSEDPDRPC